MWKAEKAAFFFLSFIEEAHTLDTVTQQASELELWASNTVQTKQDAGHNTRVAGFLPHQHELTQ